MSPLLSAARVNRLIMALAVLIGAALLQAPSALACCTPPPPPPSSCCQPPSPPSPPVVPSCCGGGPTVVVPGVSINVQSTAIAISGASASAGASGSAGSTVFIGGGGGGYLFEANTPAYLGLTVDAGEAALRSVAYEARRRIERRVVIQAVCIDDRLTPHPASQVRPEREVEADYEGELFRCIAGTRMQALIAEYRGEVRFEGASSLDCAKGEALFRSHGGEVACRPQKSERDCNERSLLRRYGAGVKILTLVREETYTAYRQERVQQRAGSVSGIVLDGGVGGFVR